MKFRRRGSCFIIVSCTYVEPEAHLLGHDGGDHGEDALALPFTLGGLLFGGESAIDLPAVVIEVSRDALLEGIGGNAEGELPSVADLGDGGGVLFGILVGGGLLVPFGGLGGVVLNVLKPVREDAFKRADVRRRLRYLQVPWRGWP